MIGRGRNGELDEDGLGIGKSAQVVPGSGCAATGITAEDDIVAAANAAAT